MLAISSACHESLKQDHIFGDITVVVEIYTPKQKNLKIKTMTSVHAISNVNMAA